MDNPAHLYRAVAKQIVLKLKQSMADNLEQGRMADPHWKLEQAIVDAMREADVMGCERTRQQFTDLMSDFEDDDGTSIS